MSFKQPNNKFGREKLGKDNDSVKFYIGFPS